MSDQALTATAKLPPVTNRVSAVPTTRKVTGRLKTALGLMVWDGLTDNQAATKAGLTVTAIRMALKQPHVRAWYREQLDVLRSRESSRNIHRLVQIRDAADNMPAVQAIKMLEAIEDKQQSNGGAPISPGLTIVINTNAANSPLTVNPGQVIDNVEDDQ